MSDDTATLERMEFSKPRHAAQGIAVVFQAESRVDAGSLAWRQISEVLCRSLGESGFTQPIETSAQGWPPPLASHISIVVAPGIVVGGDEYEQRYGAIDLEEYRKQMPPEIFGVFVRHIGSIAGAPDLELSDIVTTPE